MLAILPAASGTRCSGPAARAAHAVPRSTEFKDWWIGGPFLSTNLLGGTGVENPYSQLKERGQPLFLVNIVYYLEHNILHDII